MMMRVFISTEENSIFSFSTLAQKYTPKVVLEDYLVNKAISRKTAIYISDDLGEPTGYK
ncbi:MAG: hypothetical protein Q9M40_02160 [Sulfurimonas sp.]|nr:hypothetical protein [Sulfurimonas sp.]